MPNPDMDIQLKPSADSVRELPSAMLVSLAQKASQGDKDALSDFVLRVPSEFLQQFDNDEDAAAAALKQMTSPQSGMMAHSAGPTNTKTRKTQTDQRVQDTMAPSSYK
tara:strand:- start:138 stop:461 length:324 start_codon:yes stop_codon:yes gene_type:complete